MSGQRAAKIPSIGACSRAFFQFAATCAIAHKLGALMFDNAGQNIGNFAHHLSYREGKPSW
jgi:hypothetical protein